MSMTAYKRLKFTPLVTVPSFQRAVDGRMSARSRMLAKTVPTNIADSFEFHVATLTRKV